MSLEVNVKTINPQQVVSLTRRVKVDKLESTIQQSIKELNALVQEQNTSATAVPFGIYHGTINEQDDGPIEICLPVSGQVKTQGNVVAKQLEGGNAACVTMVGKQCNFPEILSGYDAAADWIQRNGYEMAESPREVWYAPPGEDEKIEIVWLFK